jgi:hypothetical protein
MYNAEILRITQNNYDHDKTNSKQRISLETTKLSKFLSIHILMGQNNSTERACLGEVCLFQ